MPKKQKRSAATNKKLEALARSQKFSELAKIGGIQSQALLDSGEETRPSDESHVADLLNAGGFSQLEASRLLGGVSSKAKKKAKAPARKSKTRPVKRNKQKPKLKQKKKARR